MMLKKIYLFSFICIFSLIHHTIQSTKNSELSVKIITEVADITDDLAELIINCKHEKDPQVTKKSIVKLIQHIATITEAVIDKRSQKNTTRSFQFNADDIQSDELINVLADRVIEKINFIQSEQ